MSISSSAMLVEMNISVWTAAIVDRKTTDKVTLDAHAVADAGKFRKNLMAGTSIRKDIADYAALCRTWHNGRTLPWSDKGVRLLPTSMFLEYKREADARASYFHSKVTKFVDQYPNLVDAARYNLGDLFNAGDYPSADEVASKFGFRMVFSPVPESGDFRLDLPAQELDEVKRGYEDSFKDRLADAMKEPWDRLHKTLTTISDKLTDKDDDDETKKRYHETLITNAQSLCSMLTHLNVTKDPKLEQARRELEQAMLGADIEVLRESPTERADIKGKVDAILNRFDW